VPGTGNTTVPSAPEAPSSSSHSSSPGRLVLALFLAQSYHQPERVGEVALFDSNDPSPFIVGREDVGDPPRVHLFQIRPGQTVDGGPLTGRNISRRQFDITVEGDALRVVNLGSARALANGIDIPPAASVLLRPGAILEVFGNCVLLVGLSPLSLPPARLLPLFPFGEADRQGLVGESWRMHQLREDLVLAAPSGRHVFIYGESGTGKDPVARAIHALSPRCDGPFVAANSASFTAELAALELFGNPRSYPNPGTPERKGYFAEAKGGTLFLDELGEVLAAVQAPLLRALDGSYNRVGDPVSRPTACVVIVATNRGPEGLKHDILPRLGVTVHTPSLAERREDTPQLVRALLLRRADADPTFAKAFVRHDAGGWRYVEVDASLIVGLLRSPLPGNVRDVDKILTMAIAASRGQSPLRWPARLVLPPPEPLEMATEPPAPPPPPVAPPAEPSAPDVDALVEGIRGAPKPSKTRVHRALDDNYWDFEKAAAALGISVDQLYRLRVKYGLLKPE
jgi:DNA-binding NtrC family response regulator